jgi:hypothetical protein
MGNVLTSDSSVIAALQSRATLPPGFDANNYALKTTVDTLQSRVPANLQSDISALQSRATLPPGFDANNYALKTTVDTLQSRVPANLQSDISALQSRATLPPNFDANALRTTVDDINTRTQASALNTVVDNRLKSNGMWCADGTCILPPNTTSSQFTSNLRMMPSRNPLFPTDVCIVTANGQAILCVDTNTRTVAANPQSRFQAGTGTGTSFSNSVLANLRQNQNLDTGPK